MDISEQDVEHYFDCIKLYLLSAENIFTPEEIRKRITREDGAGVYFIFDKNILCYVGESGSLSGRLKDFRRTLNHTFRRSLGTFIYSSHPKYSKVSSKIKFDYEIEYLLNEYIRDNITISYKTILIGRKEFEDWMQEKHPEIKFLNKRQKRKTAFKDIRQL